MSAFFSSWREREREREREEDEGEIKRERGGERKKESFALN